MAGSTGFEPAISSVTGWHVRPLHHEPTPRAKDSRGRGWGPGSSLVSACGAPARTTETAGEAGRPILDAMTTDRGGGIVDLRSDTVTHPSPAMRRAMYEADRK